MALAFDARSEQEVVARVSDALWRGQGGWILLPRHIHTWLAGLGASLSFITGDQRRAPWVQCGGLGWAQRLTQEPGRLGRRYVVDDLPFVRRLLGTSVRDRVRRCDSSSKPDLGHR
jgi:Glycosyl transferase WecG/TagA/CpsF family